MKDFNTQRWTGIAGIFAYILTMCVIPLHFMHSGPPPLDNVLLRTFLNMFVVMAVIVFWVGLRDLLVKANAAVQTPANIALVGALMYLVLNLVSDALQVGSALKAGGGIDPTRIGGGAEGAILLFGPFGRILIALALVAAAIAIFRSVVLPRWIGYAALIVGALHLALVPTLFSTTDPANFYSINGWNIPIAGGLYLFWILLSSIALLRRR